MARQNWPNLLYEDREIIVIDKPAGQLTVATESQRAGTAWRQVTDYLQIRNKRARACVVHRLDRDTSGVLLFTKEDSLRRALQDNWNELVETRQYLAVVSGCPPKEKGTVHSFLLENKAHVVYSAPESRGGKEAITHYEVLAQRKGYSLLRVNLDTGRKNQIRVHMADLGCPVVGDTKYGAGRGDSPLRRLGLHAQCLRLRHPVTGKELTFTAPTPAEFERLFPKTAKEEEYR